MANLEVSIGGDITDLNKKIKEAEVNLKELSKIKLEKIKLGLDTKEIEGNIKSVKQSISGYKTSIKDLGGSFAGMAPKVANGGNALTQFSRIAQDAPFGIMGIGNNITATAEAFAHLKNETGSTGGALKAVASSMMGTGGILLAVSLVTTGLTYMAQNGLTVKDVFDKLTGTFDENAMALRKAAEEGGKAASEEILNLKALVGVSQDETLSKKNRLIAVEKLQQAYPAYFGNLTQEEILTGNITKTVDDLTRALLAKAVAEKLTASSADMQLKIFQANAKLINQKNKTAALELKLAKDLADAQKSVGNSASQLAIINAKGRNAINDSKDAEQEYRDEIISGTNALNDRLAIITKLRGAGIAAEASAAKGGGEKKEVFSTPQVTGIDSELDPAGLESLSGHVVEIAKNVQGAEGVITTSMKNIKVAFDMGGVAMMEALKKFNDNANEIIANGIANTFAGLGDAIGGALASGGNIIQSAGAALLSGMGSILTELGKMAIQTGVGILAVKLALKSLNPYVAIAAGVALVAMGSAFSSGAKSLAGSGGGGGGGSPQTGASYRSPTQSITSGGMSSGGGTYVFEIEGTKLIGVLNNTLDKNKRLGGNLPIG